MIRALLAVLLAALAMPAWADSVYLLKPARVFDGVERQIVPPR